MTHFKKNSAEAKDEGKIHMNQYNLKGFSIAFQVSRLFFRCGCMRPYPV